MAESSKVRIGFIGVGAMGQAAHLRNYATLNKECEVVAIAELRFEMAQRVAARYGIPGVYRSHEELLKKERVDALVASQPFTRHGLLLPELAQAGIPLMSEKPIASSIAVAERIVRSLEENKTWLMVGYHKRSDPATVYAKAEIDRLKQSGKLGRVRYVRVTMPPGDWISGGFHDNFNGADPMPVLDHDASASDMDEATNKAFITFVNYYIHQVNLLRHLLGENYRVSYADPAGILLVAHGVSGTPGTIEMAPYSTSRGWHETALVAFEKGYVKIELPAPLILSQAGRVEIYKDGADPRVVAPILPNVHAMRNQALNFIKAVRGEAPAPCLAPEALEDLRVAREYIRLLKGV